MCRIAFGPWCLLAVAAVAVASATLLVAVDLKEAAPLGLAVVTAGLVVSAMVVPWDAVTWAKGSSSPSGAVRRPVRVVAGGRAPLRVEGLG